MRTLVATLTLLLITDAAVAATPREVLLRCVQAAGIQTEITIRSGFIGRSAFSHVDAGPGLSAERAAAINRCADRSGGHTGLGNALAHPAPARVRTAASPPPPKPVRTGSVVRPQDAYGCVEGFGVMQRGDLYCIGY
jgi:hypothetical protein